MTYVVCATWTAKVGEEDAVLEAVRKLAEASPAEPGMVLYQAHRDPQNPRVFFGLNSSPVNHFALFQA